MKGQEMAFSEPHTATPGPWTFDEVQTYSGRAFRIGAGEMLQSGKGCCIIYDDYPVNPPENERKANARLIAAAPELLEALKLFVRAEKMARDGNPPTGADELIELGEAAIAKAGGRS